MLQSDEKYWNMSKLPLSGWSTNFVWRQWLFRDWSASILYGLGPVSLTSHIWKWSTRRSKCYHFLPLQSFSIYWTLIQAKQRACSFRDFMTEIFLALEKVSKHSLALACHNFHMRGISLGNLAQKIHFLTNWQTITYAGKLFHFNKTTLNVQLNLKNTYIKQGG